MRWDKTVRQTESLPYTDVDHNNKTKHRANMCVPLR